MSTRRNIPGPRGTRATTVSTVCPAGASKLSIIVLTQDRIREYPPRLLGLYHAGLPLSEALLNLRVIGVIGNTEMFVMRGGTRNA